MGSSGFESTSGSEGPVLSFMVSDGSAFSVVAGRAATSSSSSSACCTCLVGAA